MARKKKNIKELIENILFLIPPEENLYNDIVEFKDKLLTFPEDQIDKHCKWLDLGIIIYNNLLELIIIYNNKNDEPDWIKKIVNIFNSQNKSNIMIMYI